MKKGNSTFGKWLLFAFANLFIIASITAQNNIWSLPPNYKQGPTIQLLPTQPGNIGGEDNYHGQISEHTHAAMQDANGDLLFFIVDGWVFNKDGYPFGNLYFFGSNLTTGNSEVLIIPNPDNCKQYYIVLTATDGLVSGIGHRNYPIYATLDFSEPNYVASLYNINYNGNFLNQYGTKYTGGVGQATTHDLRGGLTPYWNFTPKYQKIFLAASKLRADNSRFLFISNGENVWRFSVTGAGIVFDNNSFALDYGEGFSLSFRSGMELHEFNNGTYRIAIPYTTNFSSNVASTRVMIADLDPAGSMISSSKLFLEYPLASSSNYIFIRGLEFSPNGRYLYITHSTNSLNTEPFQVYDVQNQSFISQSLLNPQLVIEIPDFSLSQIELSGENVPGGRMYLANSTGLAAINNVNNPTNLGWNSTIQNFGYNLSTRGTGQPSKELYILPDQIDGMNYVDYLVDPVLAGIECCRENTSYNIAVADGNYEFSTNATWDGATSTNPWNANSTTAVTVKDKMIIKSGTYLTINNMRFEFAPEAQLILERGARLTINGTTLTADTRCDPNAMWHGVEVWGTLGSSQGLSSGRFKIENSSIIEHAIVGVANAKHVQDALNKPVENSFVPSHAGGVVQATNSTFRNNKKDVQYTDFFRTINGNTYSDQSRFYGCTFVTDAHLNNPSLNPQAHAYLRKVKGITFTGCVFETSVTGMVAYPDITTRGYGIQAFETLFTVDAASKFNDLFYGVYASGGTMPLQIAKITNSFFTNNFRGILFDSQVNAEVTNNNIVVDNNKNGGIFSSDLAYGLYLNFCDKYKVENNAFSTTSGYYGVYVNNSGTGANEIYRNTFTNFTVASQASGINGDGLSGINATGLEFRCNQYYNSSDFDIYVSSGLIKAFHGNCVAILEPSNNEFSYTAQYGDIWLNNNVTDNVSYQYSTGGTNIEPRLGYFSLAPAVNRTTCANLPVYDYAVNCPVRGKKTKVVLQQLVTTNKQTSTTLQAQIDGGDGDALLTKIGNIPNWQLNNELTAAAPFVSDKAMLAVINPANNVPNWIIEQTLSDNAPLSDAVFAAMVNRIPVLPDYMVKNMADLSSPLSTKEQLLLVNHAPKYADWMLEQVLVNESPLQEEVLLALLAKTPSIAGWSVSNILKKNTPLSNTVNDVFNNHIPAYANWIKNGVNTNYFVAEKATEKGQPLSVRMELDAEIAMHKKLVSRYNSDLKRVYLFDEEANDDGIKEVIELLEAETVEEVTKELTAAYLANNDFVKTTTKLTSLTNDSCKADFCKLYNCVVQYKQMPAQEAVLANNAALRLPVDQVALATTSNLEVGIAQAVLNQVYHQKIEETFEQYVPSSSSTRMSRTVDEKAEEVLGGIRVVTYPNPAKTHFTISHNLDLTTGVVVLTVYDVMSKVMIQQTLNSNDQQINSKMLTSGIYFYTVTQNNKTLKTAKLMIE